MKSSEVFGVFQHFTKQVDVLAQESQPKNPQGVKAIEGLCVSAFILSFTTLFLLVLSSTKKMVSEILGEFDLSLRCCPHRFAGGN